MISNPSVFLMQQLPVVPILFVILGGLIVTAIYWQTCPRPAMLAFLALLLLGVTTVVGVSINVMLVSIGTSRHWTVAERGAYFLEAAAVINVVRAVGYALLLGAVFIGRRAALPPAAGGLQPASPPQTRIL